MNAEQYRLLAQHYLVCAHQMTNHNDKATLLDLAGHCMERAQQAEQSQFVAQQHQQAQQAQANNPAEKSKVE
jgi:hypothetical protein